MLAVLYFALVPVWGAYIQAVVKDTLYTAVFVWFAVWCVTLADEVFHKDKNIQRKTLIMSFLTAFFVCILRQNGKYIVLPTLVCLAAVSLKKWKQMVIFLLVFMVAITGYDKAVVPMFSTAQISRRAIFSVMFQQTAKYMRSYPEEVTEEEYEIIDKVLKADIIAEEYNPRLSNSVKNTFRNNTSNENIKEYLKVWFKMFWKHPGVYLELFSSSATAIWILSITVTAFLFSRIILPDRLWQPALWIFIILREVHTSFVWQITKWPGWKCSH